MYTKWHFNCGRASSFEVHITEHHWVNKYCYLLSKAVHFLVSASVLNAQEEQLSISIWMTQNNTNVSMQAEAVLDNSPHTATLTVDLSQTSSVCESNQTCASKLNFLLFEKV